MAGILRDLDVALMGDEMTWAPVIKALRAIADHHVLVEQEREGWKERCGQAEAALKTQSFEMKELRGEVEAWRARFRALMAEDRPDTAGNRVIVLQTKLDSLGGLRDVLERAIPYLDMDAKGAEELADEIGRTLKETKP